MYMIIINRRLTMEYANLNIRTPKKTKEEAEKIFDQLGISTTTAFNIFLKQFI